MDKILSEVRPDLRDHVVGYQPANGGFLRWASVLQNGIEESKIAYKHGLVELCQQKIASGYVLLAIPRKTERRR